VKPAWTTVGEGLGDGEATGDGTGKPGLGDGSAAAGLGLGEGLIWVGGGACPWHPATSSSARPTAAAEKHRHPPPAALKYEARGVTQGVTRSLVSGVTGCRRTRPP
jgi:hypothetical protein